MRVFLAGMMLCAAVVPACAQSGIVTGSQLLKACNDPSPASQNFCTGYIEGVEDEQAANGGPCVPPGTDIAKVKDAVVNYISGNPITQRYQASRLVVIAFEGNWVCPAKAN